MASKPFYITTTLPYVNADPHVGFAMELVRADAIARYKKLLEFEVFFNTGTDEHGQKIFQKANETNVSPQTFVDGFAARFKELLPALHISEDVHFIRTTDKHHVEAAQAFWKKCDANGDIYKKQYKIKYCVGCELEKTESDLDENGRCLLHPNLEIQLIEEENYFFKFSNYQKKLLAYYEKHPDFVIPSFRFNEIKAFVERGLEDFSISRLKSKMSWGVPVPGDDDHVMYVWFDALVSYISTLGWPDSAEASSGKPALFEKFWVNGTPVQYCGKDNLRQQSAMWQAMLMSADLPNTQHIIIDGFITSGGQKMSKSLGNVISPFDLIRDFGAEAVRYYVLRELSSFEDGDMTVESFKGAYNSALANGLGNLTSRILKMVVSNGIIESESIIENPSSDVLYNKYKIGLESFNIKMSMDAIWDVVASLDRHIQSQEPFKKIKVNRDEAVKDIQYLLHDLKLIGKMLEPMMPETSEKILTCIRENKMPEAPLFQRKD